MINENDRKIIEIRAFEEYVLDLFGQNKLSGTTHTYIGEEATAVAVMGYVKTEDVVFSNHRCHGHYLAYGGEERLLLAEIMSKESGLCQGKGGSQHIHYRNFYTNGIQGGIVPNAVGAAMAMKYLGRKGKVFVFLGDGTLGQGVVYESLNIASIYDAPVVFVIEDNQYAMSTRRKDVLAGDIKKRIEGFSVKTFEMESTDVDELTDFFGEVVNYADKQRKPVCAIIHNYRLGAHSKGDDTRELTEVTAHKRNDPVELISNKTGRIVCEKIYREYREKLERIVSGLESEKHIKIVENELPRIASGASFLSKDSTRFVDRMREAFLERLEQDESILFFGEDLRDPYGGAFKATKGLSGKFDRQVLNMPISEAAIAGIAVGMGLGGMLPVAEIMFGDFVTLCFDQMLNHAAKYGWIYGGDVSIPMIVRAPMGAGRGYGPTHSQSLEKFLIGIPQLRVLALSSAIDPKIFYRVLFRSTKEPVVVIENKKLYGEKTWKISEGRYRDFFVREINNYGYPSVCFSMDPEHLPDYVAITYGGMLEDMAAAAEELMMSDEIQVDVIAITQISPLPVDDLRELIPAGVSVLTVEEGTKTAGIGAEVITCLMEKGIGITYHRIASPDIPIPNGMTLERQVIPGKDSIVDEIRRYKDGK